MRGSIPEILTIPLILLTGLIGIILSEVALGVGAASSPWPRFAVILIFFWMLHRPGHMVTLVVFAIGLTQDLVLGDIPGSGALAFIIAHTAARPLTQNMRFQPVVWRWLAFGPFVALVFFVQWMLTGLALLHLPPGELVLMQATTTFLVYPLVSITLRSILRIGRTQKRSF